MICYQTPKSEYWKHPFSNTACKVPWVYDRVSLLMLLKEISNNSWCVCTLFPPLSLVLWYVYQYEYICLCFVSVVHAVYQFCWTKHGLNSSHNDLSRGFSCLILSDSFWGARSYWQCHICVVKNRRLFERFGVFCWHHFQLNFNGSFRIYDDITFALSC